MLEHFCPGSASLRKDITLTIKTCPHCGADVELFSIDKRVACDQCGFVVYNSIQSCVQWCSYAEQCMGPEVVAQFRAKPS